MKINFNHITASQQKEMGLSNSELNIAKKIWEKVNGLQPPIIDKVITFQERTILKIFLKKYKKIQVKIQEGLKGIPTLNEKEYAIESHKQNELKVSTYLRSKLPLIIQHHQRAFTLQESLPTHKGKQEAIYRLS